MRLKSKRNIIVLDDGIVYKHFMHKHSMETELQNYNILAKNDIQIAKMLWADNILCTIAYEYVKGHTYADLCNDISGEQAKALASWLNSYYKCTNSIRGDINMRNFIYNEEKNICISVDFEEEFQHGAIEKDFGRILAFVLTYNPAFSNDKIKSVNRLYKEFRIFNLDYDIVFIEYVNEIKAMIRRREQSRFNLDDAISAINKTCLQFISQN